MERILSIAKRILGRLARGLFGTRRRVAVTLCVVVLLYGAGLGALYAGQRALLFRNGVERLDPAARYVPEMREHALRAPDGTGLVVWAAPPAPGGPTLVYFHGNAGVMGHRSGRFRWMLDRGWGVVALAYRGSGGSGGSPSEAGFAMDARMVYDALPSLIGEGVDPARTVLYGESLGSGVAVTLASERSVGGVVLETPYAAIDDLAQGMLPFYPVKGMGLVKDRFRSIDRIGRIGAPLLVMHGTWDAVIPIGHGEALFERAAHPKWYRWIARGRHHDLWDRGAKDAIEGFMDRYFPRETPLMPEAASGGAIR